MKNGLKSSFYAFAAAVFVLQFSGCDFAGSISGALKGYETVQASKRERWPYDSSEPVYLVTDDVASLSISGDIGGKTLYFVQVNPTNSAFSSENLRLVTSSEKLSRTASPYFPFFPRSASAAENNSEDVLSVQADEIDGSLLERRHFHGGKLPVPTRSSARSAVLSAASSTAEKAWSLGEKKQIYIDTDSSMSSYEQESATLRAKGENCYVWIVDKYYAESASGSSVNESVAEKYAEKFEEIYPCITNIFGDESKEIINYGTNEIVDMASVSDTGNKINIVIYDIGADYNFSSSTGVVGYFYAKDYYYVPDGTQVSADNAIVEKSNAGKYFYVDSGFANSDFDTTISTLAHEFQHMIDFNQKNMSSMKKYLSGDISKDKILSPDTAYNEMLSMLCEDMMQEKLGLKDYASPKNRIQSFNAYYYMSGIREYRNDNTSYASFSYSTSYAFGSWLARQYGGAALVSEISRNEYAGTESIVQAVNYLNKLSKTFDDLFKEFVLAVTGSASSHNATYTHNQDALQSVSYSSYDYPMKAFDLWDSNSTQYESGGKKAAYTFSLKETEFLRQYRSSAYSEYDGNGPFVLSSSSSVDELRPEYGMAIHAVGKYASADDSDTLSFSSSGAKGLRLYIVIQ